eukprot:scaffold9176_cov129-Cylindrotheca_fusiformis.AAC.10
MGVYKYSALNSCWVCFVDGSTYVKVEVESIHLTLCRSFFTTSLTFMTVLLLNDRQCRAVTIFTRLFGYSTVVVGFEKIDSKRDHGSHLNVKETMDHT